MTELDLSPLRAKRILILLGSLVMGGAERQALLLARYLRDEAQARPAVWGFTATGQVAEECQKIGIPWRGLPFWWSPRLFRNFWFTARFWAKTRGQVDIFLPYTVTPNLVAGLTWKAAGAGCCIWNQRDEGFDRMDAWVERWAVRETPLFATNSQGGVEFLQSAYNLPRERIEVIHNGVELQPAQFSRAEWRSKLDVGEQNPLVCMLANLGYKKDHTTLLDAWKTVVTGVDAAYSPVLVLAGQHGNTYPALVDQANALGIAGSLRMPGVVSDITGLLEASDVAVFSSRSEGLPNGVLEPMAVGLPVVGTDIPGIREALGSQGFEFLAPPGDAIGLAARLNQFLSNSELRQRVGAINQERIKTEFSARQACQRAASWMMKGWNERKHRSA